jgi:DNA-binding transcriptional ArsR family regulator
MKQSFYDKVKEVHNNLTILQRQSSKKVINLLTEFGELTVTQMFIKMRCEQQVVSATLSKLRRLGVVKTYRNGKYIFYSINKETIQKINNATKKIA